ncbi:hypothetical protein [Halobacillus sp. B29]|uniref:hypothetical protein n=1 Tax=Halobacillus sp. B29 TaxID=3457432 RepID=UPI003FCCCFFE
MKKSNWLAIILTITTVLGVSMFSPNTTYAEENISGKHLAKEMNNIGYNEDITKKPSTTELKMMSGEKVKKGKALEFYNNLNEDEAKVLKKFIKSNSQSVLSKVNKVVDENSEIDNKNEALKLIWSSLPDEEKTAYKSMVMPAKVVEKKTEEKKSISKNSDKMVSLAAANETYSAYYDVEGVNVLGNVLWSYWQSNTWRADGIKIHSKNVREDGNGEMVGWNFYGTNVLVNEYEYNMFDYKRTIQGRFVLDIAAKWQDQQATIEARYRASGDRSFDSWVNKYN